MKELSIEQKARAYDETLERAKQLLATSVVFDRFTIERIFPELKENEDERVRKALINYLITDEDNGVSKVGQIPIDNVIAWLEKQGEQNINVQISPSEYVNDMGGNGCYLKNATQTSTWSKKEEKVDNQNCIKSADDIKPKFKVGDWISNDMCDAHIASIEDGMYYFDEGDGLSIVFVDEHYHLWTIEDAMDGDVLACENGWTCIFKILVNDETFSSYCFMDNTKWFCETGSEYHTLREEFVKAYNGKIHPATKEQRDFLFQKMKEAGYTFDFKNKELKKLSQSEVTKISDQEEIAEIPFGAKDSELQEATYFIPKGFHAEIDDDKVVIKKGEKPAAWSKKDEKMFKYALNMIEWYSGKNEDKSRYVSDWLKSIKQRIGG